MIMGLANGEAVIPVVDRGQVGPAADGRECAGCAPPFRCGQPVGLQYMATAPLSNAVELMSSRVSWLSSCPNQLAPGE